MTDTRDNGGPAFPARPTERFDNGATITAHHGMSLRDWFAGQALASTDHAQLRDYCFGSDKSPTETAARTAYAFADAMLEARK